ncbi:sensor histidine kinase [Pseudonocardia broussonetiae]|uniref:histidine kinase n=1 Tax=Pseudonocardia broussonetiae TaxID=2736640 RepID=A0A6M6JDI8_9PSEU|nr:histidine kinase [Pseudonocardia broussonetiae]QJY45173.1 hypothetical protein HOP40_04460 [Pseudonocardia broussonetiae]
MFDLRRRGPASGTERCPTRARERLVLCAAITTVLVAESSAVLRGADASVSATVALSCATLVVAGHLLRVDREQNRSGLLLYITGAALFLSDLGAVAGPAGEPVGAITTWWAVAPLGIVMLTYPGQRVARRWHGWLLVAVGCEFVVLWTVKETLAGPFGLPVHRFEVVFGLAGTVLSIFACLALVQRWVRAAAPERSAVRAVTLVGVVLAITFAARLLIRVVVDVELVAAQWYETARAGNLICLALAPLGLLLEALRRRAARARVIESLLAVGGDAVRIEIALSRALSDPSLRLTLPAEGAPRSLGARGAGTGEGSTNGRIRRFLRSTEGAVIGIVEAHESTTRDPGQLRVVLVAAALALDNARLHAGLKRSLDEVRRSRTRIVEAAVQSRRRIERDLHDGAQQQLLAVAATLARAEVVPTEPERVLALSDARAQLSAALAELRRLARGIYPSVLSQSGLPGALPTLADNAPIPLQIDVPPHLRSVRFPAAVENTLWFVAAEATANAVKHSRAGTIRVCLRAGPGHVGMCVVDDGAGGARVLSFGGLAGLNDRVSALGGTFTVTSTTASGTRVEAELPCGS